MESLADERTYTLGEVLDLLQIKKSTFWQSGLDKLIPHTRGKWDALATEQVAMALARRRALIALGVLPKNYPLAKAAEELTLGDDLDISCPRCGLMATLRPADTPDLMRRFVRWLEDREGLETYPAACGWCGWVGFLSGNREEK